MLRARNWRLSLRGGETQPQVFECSDGEDWVLKLPGNPHLATGLCADWIGTVLAQRAGVPVIECNLVEVDELALSTMRLDTPAHSWATSGIAFGSRYLRDAKDVTGLEGAVHAISADDRARIVVTDTWLDVLDRKKPGQGQWNLLMRTDVGRGAIVVIDYGMALGELLGPPLLAPVQMEVRVPPEWRPHLDRTEIRAAIAAAEAIPGEDIRAVVQSLPPAWRAAAPRATELPNYLLTRQSSLLCCFRAGGLA
jgi:hypothetical protein